MAIKYELNAKSGTYKNKDGEEKNSYTRCGVVLKTKNGLAIKLDALPVQFDGWIYMNEPQAKDKPQQSRKQASGGGADQDIPFGPVSKYAP